MNRRNFSVAVAAIPMMSGCFWDNHFNLAWEEEVQLHDGRVIVVKVKHTYERLRSGFTRYGGTNILRDSAITFDAGGTTGLVTQELKGGWPLSLEQVDGSWYLVFYWNSDWSPSLRGGQDWGQDQNGHGQHVAVLQGTQFNAISICSLPTKVQRPNLLLHRDDLRRLASLSGSLITLQAKRSPDQTPGSPSEASIERPSPLGTFACKARVNQAQGETK
jgi:hypothetical protein